jgi:hypothetical protein
MLLPPRKLPAWLDVAAAEAERELASEPDVERPGPGRPSVAAGVRLV